MPSDRTGPSADPPTAPADGQTLTGRVGALSRVLLLSLATTAVVTGLLLLVVTVQTPRQDRYVAGARDVRTAHLAMLDQETGLRAFLLTGDQASLAPFRQGVGVLPPLTELTTAQRATLAGALASMSPQVLRYKGVEAVAADLTRWLRAPP